MNYIETKDFFKNELSNKLNDIKLIKTNMLMEILNIIIRDLLNNDFKLKKTDTGSHILIDCYKFKTKYKNYNIIINNNGSIILYKTFLYIFHTKKSIFCLDGSIMALINNFIEENENIII